ncbi:hypothetical protein SY88_22900 [Clostridiales bacterium PH28_bin88]|nr:hypothetical protein SY88_22900 [Clostridiales bacterium PH28_bin88]
MLVYVVAVEPQPVRAAKRGAKQGSTSRVNGLEQKGEEIFLKRIKKHDFFLCYRYANKGKIKLW